MSAASVTASTVPFRGAGAGSTPSAALQETPIFSVKELQVKPIPWQAAKAIFERHHYLHSMPGGSLFNLGVFGHERLYGAACFTRGPVHAYELVEAATMKDCAVLARLWLNDELPRNSESRTLGLVLRALRQHTSLKFVISYADPAQGHLGIIYQASNWLYTGLSEATPRYDLGDGVARHSRSLAHAFGTHSMAHFQANGVSIQRIPESAKHRYLYFLDPSWKPRLRVLVLPYPKREGADGAC